MEALSIPEDNATLPSIVDSRAHTTPDRLYGASAWIDEEDGTLKFRKITYRNLSDAVNRCSQWLDTKIGKSAECTTLAYAGLSDYRYLILTMAAAKTGHKALLLAPWNSRVAQLKLLDECGCDIFIAAEDSPSVQDEVKNISAQRKMKVHSLPTLDWLLDGPDWLLDEPEVPFYPFNKTLDEVRDQDYVIIHTSDSTGYPKPITYKYGAMASLKYLAMPQEIIPTAPTSNFKEVWSNRCHLMALPSWDTGGVLGLGPFNIYWNMPMILSPEDCPITSTILAQIFSQDICEAAFVPPAYLKELSCNPAEIQTLHELKHILWVDAPWTSSDVADAIRARVEIQPAYGSSEAGPFAFILEKQDDYSWMHFHPIMGATMRYFSEDLYELVLEKKPEIEKAQFVFQNFPHLAEWPMKDLYSKHPTRDDLWQFRGRKDDILLISNALNVDSSLMEANVSTHPKVKAALLCGSEKNRTCLLVEAIEPPTSAEEISALVEDIWPNVESSNKIVPEVARVRKSLILFATKDKPFLRGGKTSLQRARTIAAYDQELSELLNAVENGLLKG